MAQPIGTDDFGIVVQEQQQLTGRLRRCPVIEERKIERLVIANHTNPRIGCDLSKVSVRRRFLTAIVDDQQFEFPVAGAIENPIYAARQQIPLVLCRDDYADRRLDVEAIADLEKRRPVDELDLRADASPLQMIPDGSPPCLHRIGLRARGSGSGAGGGAPMIQDMRDMADALRLRLLDNSQREIIIL